MAAPVPYKDGFPDPPEDFSPFFSPDWWIPIAYVVLVILLIWRFSRTQPPRKAVTYAFVGAWLGCLIPAALISVLCLLSPSTLAASIWLRKVAILVVVLLAVTLTAAGLCAIGPGRARRD
jgi:hypothetical protein